MRIKRRKLTERQKNELVKLFVAGTTARAASEVVGVNRNTAILFFSRCRMAIAAHQERQWPFYGEVEVDESYFGGRRKGKRGRGAAEKVPVFGILKRGGKVYAQVIAKNPQFVLVLSMSAPKIRVACGGPSDHVYFFAWSSSHVRNPSNANTVRRMCSRSLKDRAAITVRSVSIPSMWIKMDREIGQPSVRGLWNPSVLNRKDRSL